MHHPDSGTSETFCSVASSVQTLTAVIWKGVCTILTRSVFLLVPRGLYLYSELQFIPETAGISVVMHFTLFRISPLTSPETVHTSGKSGHIFKNAFVCHCGITSYLYFSSVRHGSCLDKLQQLKHHWILPCTLF